MDTLAISVRRAQIEDAVALAELVNDCYRVEKFFVDGDRTNADEIAQLIAGEGVFLVLEDARGLAAAIYLDGREDDLYFGMLSVREDMQGEGLGTRLVRIAEAMAEAMGAAQVTLKIVNLREELGRWYRSLGYREAGTAPYTHRSVKQPCHFVDMYKAIASGAPGRPVDAGLLASLGAA